MLGFITESWWSLVLSASTSGCQGNKEECIREAFKAGAGVEPKQLSQGISAIIMMVVIIWVAWLAMAQYQSFAKGEITFFDMFWRIIRAAIVLLLFSVFVGGNL